MRAVLPQNILNLLKRMPILSAAEEQELVIRLRGGDGAAGERLVMSQLRFVVRIARRYRSDSCPLADLVQEGTVGLLEAIRRFDPRRGLRLSTFAGWWIRAAIQDYVLRSSSIVRIATTPRHRAMFFNPALSGEGEPSQDALEALAARFGTSVDDVRAFSERVRRRAVVIDELAADLPPFHTVLADREPDPEERLANKRERMDLIHKLRVAIPALTRRERHILRRRFLTDRRESLAKIGRDLGLSKERVRQLEERALAKLRSVTASAPGREIPV